MPRLSRTQKVELRRQTIDPVRAIMDALVQSGFTTQEAGKAVRHATHVLEGQARNE